MTSAASFKQATKIRRGPKPRPPSAPGALQFCLWMARLDLTIASAANALGLSARQVAYYRSGEQDVPRVVELACRAIESTPASPQRRRRVVIRSA